ncbi:MAG: peptidoglycan-binding protein LysM [candidate division KSB1 bacterium]|nr:peptidoglycan-binding protein LysM [candidate division KSB1 bacterium]
MGLFNFIKGVGASILGKGKEAENVRQLLESSLGDKITNLQVTFKDGLVTLAGQCDSQATKEKAVLLAGNVKGVEKVNDDLLTAPVEKKEEAEFYTIRPGDTLSKIAKTYYGNANKYPIIFEANREVIKDPNLIYPGQVIRIPKLPS